MDLWTYGPMDLWTYDAFSMRFARRTLLLLLLTVVLAGIVWGPTYARGLSLVVRAAHIEGWLGHVAGMQVHAWHAQCGRATSHASRPDRVAALCARGQGPSRHGPHAGHPRHGDRRAPLEGPRRGSRSQWSGGAHNRAPRSRHATASPSMRWTRSRTPGCGCRGNQRSRQMARLA